MVKNTQGSFNSSIKMKGLKLSPKKSSLNNPIKLDKDLKSIENRILQKLRNKNSNKNNSHSNMPSIERNSSPNIGGGKTNMPKVKDYGLKGLKNNRYSDADEKGQSSVDFDRHGGVSRGDRNGSHAVRQTVAGSFRPSDPDSVLKGLQVNKPIKDQYSEYDMYNSYGSSNGFIDERKLSDRMKNRIKASFGIRDEVETSDSGSLFSSKFSGFNVPNQGDSNLLPKPSQNMIVQMMKKHSDHSKPSNFPSISKNVPAKGFALPSLK